MITINDMHASINTGIDLVEIERIEKAIENNPKFLKRYFGEDEISMFYKKSNAKSRMQSIAGNFAAKEAFSKALGTGIRNFVLSDVQILRNELGAPYFKLSENINTYGYQFSLSISHTDNYATAIVISYSNCTE